ncbi:hypothetical protein PoB_007576600 [Plakobranchus ocellatus]|uniref:Uncharacterized protein n=1 Tax=Plakobranchus ocellatus TaxID=259542 RepID=A0AAV4DZH9_9GAST|nr:hypothetical protein PoB_007576600 [Plakobranchus ocellatus]
MENHRRCQWTYQSKRFFGYRSPIDKHTRDDACVIINTSPGAMVDSHSGVEEGERKRAEIERERNKMTEKGDGQRRKTARMAGDEGMGTSDIKVTVKLGNKNYLLFYCEESGLSW